MTVALFIASKFTCEIRKHWCFCRGPESTRNLSHRVFGCQTQISQTALHLLITVVHLLTLWGEGGFEAHNKLTAYICVLPIT